MVDKITQISIPSNYKQIKSEQNTAPNFGRNKKEKTSQELTSAYITSKEMTMGAFKGVIFGFIVGTGVAAYGVKKNLTKKIKNFQFADIIKKPREILGKTGTIFAPITAASILAFELILSKHRANVKLKEHK